MVRVQPAAGVILTHEKKRGEITTTWKNHVFSHYEKKKKKHRPAGRISVGVRPRRPKCGPFGCRIWPRRQYECGWSVNHTILHHAFPCSLIGRSCCRWQAGLLLSPLHCTFGFFYRKKHILMMKIWKIFRFGKTEPP